MLAVAFQVAASSRGSLEPREEATTISSRMEPRGEDDAGLVPVALKDLGSLQMTEAARELNGSRQAGSTADSADQQQSLKTPEFQCR